LATYAFTAPFDSFVNDVIVTADAAWFTDSGTQNSPDPGSFVFAGSPRLFKVPLGRAGALPDGGAVEEIAVAAPDLTFPNLNGIETAPWSGEILVNHTTDAAVFAVDPDTGAASEVYSGGLAGADGMSRRGTTLYVVENGASRIAEIRLDPASGTGTLTRTLPVTGAETPTTSALFGSAIYAVDARFGSMSGPYKAFRVDLSSRPPQTTR
jgi:sugar lactone lactonase YvrE